MNKTKEQLAEEYAGSLYPDKYQDAPYTTRGDLFVLAEDSFKKGFEAAEPKWISVSDEKPHCYRLGFWDGKRSDFVTGRDKGGKLHIACLYSGFMDGSEFNDWYDQNDFSIEIIEWCKIPD